MKPRSLTSSNQSIVPCVAPLSTGSAGALCAGRTGAQRLPTTRSAERRSSPQDPSGRLGGFALDLRAGRASASSRSQSSTSHGRNAPRRRGTRSASGHSARPEPEQTATAYAQDAAPDERSAGRSPEDYLVRQVRTHRGGAHHSFGADLVGQTYELDLDPHPRSAQLREVSQGAGRLMATGVMAVDELPREPVDARCHRAPRIGVRELGVVQ
jgi:hypothetical protein